MLGRSAEEIFREFALHGGAGTDFSAIINSIRDASDSAGLASAGPDHADTDDADTD